MTEGTSINDVLDRPIRKFNPGTFQSDDEVVRQFVVRQEEFDLVLEVVRGNIDSPSCQHVLIVAPRGRGKTMLLARVGAELRTDTALSEHLFPVRFTEESQEIFTLADFWLEALFHLAHANARDNPEFSQELLATYADLTARWRDTNIEGHARVAVLEAADRLGRKLVLMVENLQALCSDVDDDFGWQLRQTLQSDPQIMLLATATSRFTGLDDATQPFFELFRIVDLESLDTDACRRLWNMVSGDAQTNREIKPLQILTGGNPRLLIIVATFARHRSLRHLLEDLVTLVDDHTEYFRSHLEGLAKTERRVYLAVIDLWQPSSAHEIAARARKDIRTVSALITRLVDRGAVLVEGTGRKRKYAAAERLYSIYYKLRRERDEAGLVRNLIQFMAAFYRSDELGDMASTWLVEAAQSPPIREGLERALAASDTLDLQMEVAKALLFNGITHGQRDESEAALATYDDLVARFGASDAPDLHLQVAKALLFKGITHGQRDESEAALATYDDLIARFGASDAPDLRLQVAKALVNKGVTHGQRDESEAALATYDDLIARFGASDTPDLRLQVAMALFNRGVTHGQRDESEAALATYDDLIARFGASDAPDLRLQVAKALFFKGITHGQHDESEAALATYDDLVTRFGASDAPDLQLQVAKALLFKGITHGQRDESEAALATYDDLVARFGASDAPDLQLQVAMALFGKGITHGQRDESAAALATYDDLVARFGASDAPDLRLQVAMALVNKGVTHGQRDESEVALATYDDLIARFGASDAPDLRLQVAKALFGKGVTHGQRDESEAALATYDDLVARFGASDAPNLRLQVAMALVNKGVTHGQRDESEVALATYDDLIARFGASDAPDLRLQVAKALFGKGVTHGQRDESEAALATYDDLVARFGASDAPNLRLQVAMALVNKGVTHGQRDEFEAELATYDDLVARFGASDAPDLQLQVAKALVGKGNRQIEIGRPEEALRTSDELDRRFGAITDNEPSEVAWWRWRARWMRTHALLVRKERLSALSVFQSVCAMFVSGNDTMLREMLTRIPILIAAGMAEHDLIKILSADQKTAGALAPLIVALRLLAGESVRASDEVREVAADVLRDIVAAKRQGTGRVAPATGRSLA